MTDPSMATPPAEEASPSPGRADGPRPGPLAGWIASTSVEEFDRVVDGWAEHLRGHRFTDRMFYGLSRIGDHGLVWHAVGLGRVTLGHGTFASAVQLSSALGVEAAIVNGPMKWLFRRPRPESTSPRPHHLRQPRTSSFPSGHASAGMFAAMLVANGSRRRWPWYALGGLIGWSRVHVRIHHPSDVVGGTIVGLALGRAALHILHKPIR